MNGHLHGNHLNRTSDYPVLYFCHTKKAFQFYIANRFPMPFDHLAIKTACEDDRPIMQTWGYEFPEERYTMDPYTATKKLKNECMVDDPGMNLNCPWGRMKCGQSLYQYMLKGPGIPPSQEDPPTVRISYIGESNSGMIAYTWSSTML